MRNLKKTAIAMGVAQIAFIYSNPVAAQTATEPAASGPVVVVTGQRAALQSAQKLKQNADEVVDSIVADDIGKLPDRSVTEVLQRIVGVTMERTMSGDPQHFAVEGSGIQIRGLTYVRSELNGRESFSANGGRSLNFEDVPPELMSGVDVYKNPSAEQIEGGISGLVNLRTKLPFDHKGFKGGVTVEGSYSALRKDKPTPSYSLLLSDRWKTGLGEFGLLVDFAKSQSETRTDAYQLDPLYPRTDLEPGRTLWVPKGALWRTTEFERERQGKYVAAQWRPFQGMTNTLTWFKSEYQMRWSEQALLMQHDAPFQIGVRNGVYNEAGAFQSGTLYDTRAGSRGINFNPDRRVSNRESSTTDLAFKSEWRVTPSWTLTADVQKIKADTDSIDSDVATGFQMLEQTLDVTGDLPKLSFTDAQRAALADPKNYYWAYTMEHLDRGTADSKALKLDARYDFDDHAYLRDVRFGVRATDRNAMTQNSNPSYNWVGVTQPWMIGGGANQITQLADLQRFPNETTVHQFENFFMGDSTVPAVVFPNDSLAAGYPDTYAQLHAYRGQLCAGNACSVWAPAAFNNNPASVNNVNEKTKAAFAQLRFGFDDLKYPIDGNVGLRYVKTTTEADGYTVYTPGTVPTGAGLTGIPIPDIAALAAPQAYSHTYDNWLPSFNLKLKATDTLQFRVAIAKAMSRASFSQLQGYTTLSRSISSVTNTATNVTNITNVTLSGEGRGNPMLKPVTSTQIDLTAEWYPAPGKSLTLAVFNKDLKDIILNQMSLYPLADRSGTIQNFQISSPVNGAKGKARGFEIAGQTYFDNLPNWASGLGVQASFTFVDSSRKLYNAVEADWCTGAGEEASNVNLFINGCDTNGQTFKNLPLEGLSRRSINFALLYDKGPVSARLAYNWRSRNLQQVAGWGVRQNDGRNLDPRATPAADGTPPRIYYGLPLWADDYGQLDGGISYKFNDNLSLGLEAQNLADAVFKQDMEQHVGMIKHAWFTTGPRYTVKLMGSF